ncbi:ABC transporter ATP-binding protein [Desulfomicrobium sp. ZS1]|uniref:ABC transporter ATP-binding protein n=1 Tax=Desulfomicrobium sp. ZS1 TaxID=2952228 RepID=UPI0020B36AEA|nr:ABC transporter ATP-binding protein [Desulfomicrobium sp. ZS1]UTF51715.1 ABC transporter ATP-binding protein [Desulfomicrobium sp. ZS1]
MTHYHNDESDIAIKVQGLAKKFGAVQAVASVDFEVNAGELFGFLGPNGAGKTTTINMLTGLARPDAGKIHIGGIDCTQRPRGAQHLIGVVPDESNLYPELSGFDNLCFCAALYGLDKSERQARARELLDTFDLANAAERKFGGYSKGMKRRLTIAAGIIHRPKILFLDEPTSGIDVASARHMRQLIGDLHKSGTTIFLTTHYIDEAERLCDRIAFIMSGRIVRVDSVANLIQPIRQKHVMQIAFENGQGELTGELSEAFPGLNFICHQPGLIQVEGKEPVRVGPLVRFLEDRGAEVSEARKIRPSLEDVFVQITGVGADMMRKEKEKTGGNQ